MANLARGIKKVLFFAVCAALGCLIAAGFGEILLAFTLPPQAQADVLFVLDVSGSMDGEINGVRDGIKEFVSELRDQELDARVGLIAFGDLTKGEKPKILFFSEQVFTDDISSFSSRVGKIERYAGGPEGESSLDALVLGARQPFRSQATKVIILITDEPPKVPDVEIASIEAAVQVLQQQQINQLHLVVQNSDRAAFAGLQEGSPGKVFSIAETAEGRQGFDQLLPEVGKQIAAITTSTFPRSQFQSLLIATSLWTGVLAVGTFLALIVAQNSYLRHPILRVGQAIAGALGSLAAGLVAGAVGQLPLYEGLGGVAALQLAGRIVAWSLLGGLLGWGMAFFLPNLNPRRALVGGGVGGAMGAVGFLGAASALDDMAGRLLGAAILGFFIGLAIAFIEAAFRQAWLEVEYGPQEVRTVNLGAEPVSIGSDAKACTIYACNAPPVALRFRLDRGQIFCENVPTGAIQQLQPGDLQRVGNLAVVTRAAGQAGGLAEHPSSYQEVPPHTQVQTQFSLYVKKRMISLTNGTQLRANDLPGLESQRADGVVAQVNPNPNNSSILGLQNCSSGIWVATLSSGEQRQVASGRSIKLATGTKINFGSVAGEIRQ